MPPTSPIALGSILPREVSDGLSSEDVQRLHGIIAGWTTQIYVAYRSEATATARKREASNTSMLHKRVKRALMELNRVCNYSDKLTSEDNPNFPFAAWVGWVSQGIYEARSQ